MQILRDFQTCTLFERDRVGFLLFNALGGIAEANDHTQVQGLAPPMHLSYRFIAITQGLPKLGIHLVVVSKYRFPVKKN